MSGKWVPSIRLIFFIFQAVFRLAETKTHTILKQEQPDHIIQALSVPLQRAMYNTILYKLYKCNIVLLHKLLDSLDSLIFLCNFNRTKTSVVRAGTIVR